jgi:hypothetical protein
MSSELLLDATGRPRSPAAMPGHNAGHAPRNKGRVYPADPPTVDEMSRSCAKHRPTGTVCGCGR